MRPAYTVECYYKTLDLSYWRYRTLRVLTYGTYFSMLSLSLFSCSSIGDHHF
jgi:hypothetical protein